ncbi:MAG: prolipoprotein diacylglyceryl transferase family protein, partial [Elusimicrobiota bacterium]
MFPTLLRLGEFRLAAYGAFTAAGYLLGIVYLNSQRERLGLGEEKFWRLIYAVFFGALAGGKLAYLAVSWRELSIDGASLLELLRSGFVFYGGFAGALIAGALMARRIRLPFWPSADLFALADA